MTTTTKTQTATENLDGTDAYLIGLYNSVRANGYTDKDVAFYTAELARLGR